MQWRTCTILNWVHTLQDQDNPQHYSNSTCGVHIIPEPEDTEQPPSKRLKRGSGHMESQAAADAERLGSGALATSSGQAPGRPIGQSRTNPIDHIFQFHKARTFRALLQRGSYHHGGAIGECK